MRVQRLGRTYSPAHRSLDQSCRPGDATHSGRQTVCRRDASVASHQCLLSHLPRDFRHASTAPVQPVVITAAHVIPVDPVLVVLAMLVTVMLKPALTTPAVTFAARVVGRRTGLAALARQPAAVPAPPVIKSPDLHGPALVEPVKI